MSRNTLIGISILLAAAAHAAPSAAQSVQAKTHVGGKPSGFVSLIATLSPGDTEPALLTTSEGGAGEPFVLPAKTVLVVTDFHAEGSGAAGPRYVSACTGGNCVNAVLRLSFDTTAELSRSFSLASGVVFREPPLLSCAGASAGTCQARLYGYLAKDK